MALIPSESAYAANPLEAAITAADGNTLNLMAMPVSSLIKRAPITLPPNTSIRATAHFITRSVCRASWSWSKANCSRLSPPATCPTS